MEPGKLFYVLANLFFGTLFHNITIYISSALIGMGDLLTSLFNLRYGIAIFIGILIVVPYVFTGGYMTLAWIDLFQGFFLLGVIICIPLYLLRSVGRFNGILKSFDTHGLSLTLIPSFSTQTLVFIISSALGWGLGYFGQPHIVTKFMGIKNVSEIHKSKWIGMSWMTLSLSAATLVGAIGVPFFNGILKNPEEVFIKMVQTSFHPFIVGFVLCAVMAATINAMSSQVLVLSSSLTEDLYKRIFRKHASSSELLVVSRIGVILAGLIAFAIAYNKTSTIYNLVSYAWAGIGSSFGPLVLLSLYSNRVNKYGAWAGILGGSFVAGIWPFINKSIFPTLPGFLMSLLLILCVSYATKEKSRELAE